MQFLSHIAVFFVEKRLEAEVPRPINNISIRVLHNLQIKS